MLSSELGVHIFLHWCSQSSNCPAILLLYLQIPQKKHMLNLPNKLSTLWELFFEPCCCFCLAPREDAPCTACSWGSGFFDIWAVGAQGVWFPRNRKQLPLWAWIPWLTPGLSGPSHIFVKHCCQIVGALWLITWQWSAAVPLEQGIYLQVTLGSTQSCLVCLSGASCPFCTFSILSSGCVSSLALFKCYFCTSATLQLQPCGEHPHRGWRHCCTCRGWWAAHHSCLAMGLGPFEKRGVPHQRVISGRTTRSFGICEEMLGFKKPRVDSV